MKYLIRKRGAHTRAHIWDGTDTACRMWSTGGLVKQNFAVYDDKGGREICLMCSVTQARREREAQDVMMEDQP